MSRVCAEVMKDIQNEISMDLGSALNSVGVPSWLSGKESACQRRRHRGFRLDPWVGKISLKKKMPTHCSIFAWRIPLTEEPGGLWSV